MDSLLVAAQTRRRSNLHALRHEYGRLPRPCLSKQLSLERTPAPLRPTSSPSPLL